MAITGAIFKTLTFNGESSKNYGIYITGQGVFNAPTRDVEMITIPGRNGSFPLDHGRFENIEVTYPAGIYADNESDFADAISDFRNMLCSAEGYCRLEDDYNPDEYRMAIYKSGLEVEPAALKAGEFEITFECQPQRFLKSGETPEAIGSTTKSFVNPTRFDAFPEFQVKGYGTITVTGQGTITINDDVYGSVEWGNNTEIIGTYNLKADTYLSNGDSFTILASPSVYLRNTIGRNSLVEVKRNTQADNGTAGCRLAGTYDAEHWITGATFNFVKGTSSSGTATAEFHNFYDDGTPLYASINYSITFTLSYISASDELQYSVTVTASPNIFTQESLSCRISSITGNSTKSILGNPTIVDCGIGEAYKIENDEAISLNKYISLGANPPVLKGGSTTNISRTTSNMTECKVIPRWWKV